MYRRLPVCRIADFQSARFEGFPKVSGLYRALPTGSRRHSRLETCGTPCTADFQSAVSRISNPRGLGVFRRLRVCTGPCRLEVGDTAGWKPAARHVPQTSSLPCRGFPIREVWGFSEGFGFVQGLADWKSAIQQVGNLRHTSYRRHLVCRVADFQSARFGFFSGLRVCPEFCRLEVGDTRLPGGRQAAGWKLIPAAPPSRSCFRKRQWIDFSRDASRGKPRTGSRQA